MTQDPRPDPALIRVGEACLARRIRQASRLLTSIYEEALSSHGLKASQFSILIAVGSLGEATPAQLMHGLDLEKSTVSRGADRLAAAGWLDRGPAPEGRGVAYRLTAAGRAKVEAALPDWRKAQARAKRRIGSEGASALARVVQGLRGGEASD